MPDLMTEIPQVHERSRLPDLDLNGIPPEEFYAVVAYQQPNRMISLTRPDNTHALYAGKNLKLGYTDEQWQKLEGHLWRASLHPEDRERVLQEVKQCHETGVFQSEYRLVGTDGVHWIRDTGKVYRDDHGELIFVSEMEDITKEKEREEVLLQENDALRQENAELKELVIRDPMTGVYNRRHLEEIGAREVEKAKRTGRSMGTIMVDIDHFKTFNDTYGHEAGDVTLTGVAQKCAGGVKRAWDTFCRYGGEEFTDIVTEAEIPDMLKIAERLRYNVARDPVQHEEAKKSYQVTISLGLAMVHPEDGSFDQLLSKADEALYVAKKAGRNAVGVYFQEEQDIYVAVYKPEGTSTNITLWRRQGENDYGTAPIGEYRVTVSGEKEKQVASIDKLQDDTPVPFASADMYQNTLHIADEFQETCSFAERTCIDIFCRSQVIEEKKP